MFIDFVTFLAATHFGHIQKGATLFSTRIFGPQSFRPQTNWSNTHLGRWHLAQTKHVARHLGQFQTYFDIEISDKHTFYAPKISDSENEKLLLANY